MAASSNNLGWGKALWLWLPLLAVMSFIFYASSVPGKNIPCLFPLQDILFHGIIYASLGFLFKRALKNTCPRLNTVNLILLTVIFGILYGSSDEFHQFFVPGRDPSLGDALVDTIGSFLGGIIYK